MLTFLQQHQAAQIPDRDVVSTSGVIADQDGGTRGAIVAVHLLGERDG
jgi:hypothetical protein